MINTLPSDQCSKSDFNEAVLTLTVGTPTTHASGPNWRPGPHRIKPADAALNFSILPPKQAIVVQTKHTPP